MALELGHIGKLFNVYSVHGTLWLAWSAQLVAYYPVPFHLFYQTSQSDSETMLERGRGNGWPLRL